ncbi:hypothetical protein BS47DRAFT_1309177, partial [Hydnum rufescens UP504]
TQAAQKLPDDYKQQIHHSLLWQALSIHDYNIPAALCVNSDQTQVVYQHSDAMTYEKTGASQVATAGQEEKHAITVNIAISASGILLPLQAIYQSKSPKTLPNETCKGYAKAIGLGFRFKSSLTDTYWATLDMMKSFVTHILVPYFLSQKIDLNLSHLHKCIWQIDVWPVHTSVDLHSWLYEKYPWIILDYVPGGCTGIFQPCDVGIQRIFKHSVQRSQQADIVNKVLHQLDGSAEPGSVCLDMKIGTLHKCNIATLLKAYHATNNKETVLRVGYHIIKHFVY